MTDEIRLTIPRDRALYSVAHLVLGGVGIRLNLTIEHLEDLQLALDAVLERAREAEDVTIALRVKDGEIETAIGPLRDGIRGELEARLPGRTSGSAGSSTPSSTGSSSAQVKAATGSTLTKAVEARSK